MCGGGGRLAHATHLCRPVLYTVAMLPEGQGIRLGDLGPNPPSF